MSLVYTVAVYQMFGEQATWLRQDLMERTEELLEVLDFQLDNVNGRDGWDLRSFCLGQKVNLFYV